jgi:hypothetical protein
MVMGYEKECSFRIADSNRVDYFNQSINFEEKQP